MTSTEFLKINKGISLSATSEVSKMLLIVFGLINFFVIFEVEKQADYILEIQLFKGK